MQAIISVDFFYLKIKVDTLHDVTKYFYWGCKAVDKFYDHPYDIHCKKKKGDI